MGTSFTANRSLPALNLEDTAGTSARASVTGKAPMAGGLRTLGAYTDIRLVLGHRLTLPMGGLGVQTPVGDQAAVRTALDGSLVTMHPSRTLVVDILGPGLGIRATERRFFFEATVRLSILWLSMPGDIAAGAEASETRLYGLAPGVRMELSGCRRLDPTNRLCLTVAPHVYEVAFANGVSVGLSWIWGR